MTIDPRQFWEEKILDWEAGRYGPIRTRGPLLERLAYKASASLRFRIAVTPQLLRPHIRGRRVIELGCGSGQIANQLVESGATSYLGVDISRNAIDHARSQYGAGDPRIRFEVGGIADARATEGSIVVSLGLLDWLNDSELAQLFRQTAGADFLHSIAEKRSDLHQWVHRLYVHFAYGHRTGGYQPRYYRCSELAAVVRNFRPGGLFVFRDRRLSFGALLSSLPIGIPFRDKP